MSVRKCICILAAAAALILLAGCVAERPDTGEQACVRSGGTISIRSCCAAGGDFPNTCLIGACGCAPADSHEVKVCDCGEGKCWNGTGCVKIPSGFLECVEAGYPVTISRPRQCMGPDGRIYVE